MYANYPSTSRLEVLGMLFFKFYENNKYNLRREVKLDNLIIGNNFVINIEDVDFIYKYDKSKNTIEIGKRF